MRLVCFDTQIVIWGIQGNASSTQQYMVPRTKNFLRYLTGQKTKVLIPSVVLAEFLLGIPSDMHANVVAYFQNTFIVAPFDVNAAAIYAQVWRENKESQVYQTLREDDVRKTEISFDNQIVAIALARRATTIYSHDPHLKRFAGERIEVCEVPDILMQLELGLEDTPDYE